MKKNLRLTATSNGLLIMQPEISELGSDTVTAAFTTRVALGNTGPGFVNYGFNGSLPDARETRKKLCESLSLSFGCLTVGNQVHESSVAVVGKELAGSGAGEPETRIPATDALVTAVPGVALAVLTADCLPVLLYDCKRGCVGAAHAGWRGIVGGVLENTAAEMNSSFGAGLENIHAIIGPSIGPCCFEIKKDVADTLTPEEAEHVSIRDDRIFLDLWKLAEMKLVDAGLKKDSLHFTEVCTCCTTGLFYSHRGDTNIRGSNLSLIALRKDADM